MSRTNKVGARVSQSWSYRALDPLWRHLDSLVPVLLLVSPLEVSAQQPRKWISSSPEQADWKRVLNYTRLVRTLKCSDKAIIGGKVRPIAASVFKDIHFYRVSDEPLFANLTKLEWTTSDTDTASAVLQLVSARLNYLTITVGSHVGPSAYRTLIKHLTGRIPNSRHFGICTTLPAGSVTIELAACVQAMPCLVTLVLPQFYLREEIARAASQLKTLKKLDTSWTTEGIVYDETTMQLPLEHKQLQALEFLRVDSHPQQLATFLSVSTYPNLTYLGLSTRKLADQRDLLELCKAVARSCPVLETVALNLFSNRRGLSTTGAIVFNTIRPLLACSRLVALKLGSGHPIVVQESELGEMGAAWGSMEVLDLTHDPSLKNVTEEAPGIPLSTLRTIGKAFPKLMTLYLYFSRDAILQPEDADWSARYFPALRSLGVGVSPVPQGDTKDVALFLGNVCPTAEIKLFRSRWRVAAAGINGAEEPELEQRVLAWTEVIELRRMLLQFGDGIRMGLAIENQKLKDNNQKLVAELRDRAGTNPSTTPSVQESGLS